MLYFQLKAVNLIIGFPKGQTPSNRGTQSQWVLRQMSEDSRVAEETAVEVNPKVLPLGFFVGEKMRPPRVYKEETVYYVTVRASSRELLFRAESDYAYFLEALKSRKQKYNFKLYAYCLLPQHYHLLLEPIQSENLSKIMQAINTTYSLYFNKKYSRIGHLIAGRFETRLFNKDETLLQQSIHLHLNPLRLGLAQRLEDYKWSSYSEFIEAGCGVRVAGTNNLCLTDKDYILNGLSGKQEATSMEIASSPSAPRNDQLGIPIYKELAQDKARELLENENPPLPPFTKGGTGGILGKISYGVFVSGLIIGLIILPKMLMYKTSEKGLSKDTQISLPEGLPFYSANKTQRKTQVWEAWKLGPFNNQGDKNELAQ